MKQILPLLLCLCLLLTGCRRGGAPLEGGATSQEEAESSVADAEEVAEQFDSKPEESLEEADEERSAVEEDMPEEISSLSEAAAAEAGRPAEELAASQSAPSSEAVGQGEAGQSTVSSAEESQPPAQAEQGTGDTAQQHSVLAPTDGLSTQEIELELLRLINRERELGGLEPLGMEDSMLWAARIRAPEVLQDLSHTRPDGRPYYTAFDEAGFPYAGKWHGENVSYMSFSTGTFTAQQAAVHIFERLKSSPGHYQNMMGELYVQVGIGVYIDTVGNTVSIGAAQMFASL